MYPKSPVSPIFSYRYRGVFGILMFQGCVSVDYLIMKRVDIKTSRGKAEHHSKYREFRVKMKIHTPLSI